LSRGVPEGWVESTFGSLLRPSKKKAQPSAAKGRPYIGLEHIESGTNRITGHADSSVVRSTASVFSEGDVLFSKLRPYLNKVAIAPFDGVGSTEILVFEKRPYLDSRYLMWLLSRPETVRIANDRAAGVQLPRITFEKISDIEVPVPPLAEQYRIVEKAERLLQQVNFAKERIEGVLQTLRRFRQAVLITAYAGELTKAWREEHPNARLPLLPNLTGEGPRGRRGANASNETALLVDDEMPELPEHWSYVRLDRLAEPGTFITYGIVLPGPEVKGGVPYVRGQDVEDGWIRTNELRHTTREIAAKHERSSLREGDVLLCIIRNLRVAVVPKGLDGGNITQGMVRIRVNSAVADRDFIALYLMSPPAQSWMKRRYFGMDMPRINVEDARAVPIPVPPRTEQLEISRQVKRLMALADAIERQVGDAAARADHLHQAVLSRAFSGDLVATEAELARLEGRTFETAEELLKQVVVPVEAPPGRAARARRNRSAR
jgi:type I restriction enzyme, S subunit